MAAESKMLPLNTQMPRFELTDVVTGQVVSSEGLRGAPAIVAFICNHCPFVVHIREGLADFGSYCQTKGVRMVAICSNDAERYPADGPEAMVTEAQSQNYLFPYLHDPTQEVALAFRAACTPDIFLFDADSKLVYRGQFDDSRPNNNKPVTGESLRSAVEAVLSGQRPSEQQVPSVGCSIKWKPGVQPDY